MQIGRLETQSSIKPNGFQVVDSNREPQANVQLLQLGNADSRCSSTLRQPDRIEATSEAEG
jgi:hypothetical protein